MRRTISAGTEPLALDRGDLAAGFAGDDDAGGNVVSVFAEERRGLQPVGGDECLFATGTAQVAEPAGQGPWIDGPQGVGADAYIILIVELAGIVGDASRWPSSQAPPPLTAQNNSLRGGMTITPRTGSPAMIKPMLMAQSGRPWTRFPVPSIGSIDQRPGPSRLRLHIPRP